MIHRAPGTLFRTRRPPPARCVCLFVCFRFFRGPRYRWCAKCKCLFFATARPFRFSDGLQCLSAKAAVKTPFLEPPLLFVQSPAGVEKHAPSRDSLDISTLDLSYHQLPNAWKPRSETTVGRTNSPVCPRVSLFLELCSSQGAV